MEEKAIKYGMPYGTGYRRNMITYRKSGVICQGTIAFCRRFQPDARTATRMTRAAQSFKDAVEEIWTSNTLTKRTGLKLCKSAHVALDGLHTDYLACLKMYDAQEWLPFCKQKDAARAFTVRHVDWSEWQRLFETWSAEMACNMMLLLIQQTQSLIHRQTVQWQEEACWFGGMHAPKPAEAARPVDPRKSWHRSVYRCLSTAETPHELTIRIAEIREMLIRSASVIRRKKGWR